MGASTSTPPAGFTYIEQVNAGPVNLCAYGSSCSKDCGHRAMPSHPDDAPTPRDERSSRSDGSGHFSPSPTSDDLSGAGACCLAWALSQHEQETVEPETLLRFHRELAQYLAFFHATILVDEATCGIILGRELNNTISAADALVRFGQLLCRWAAEQAPMFGLRIGVHIGCLRGMQLPNSNSRFTYFGDACTTAWRLADTAEQDRVVHMSLKVQQQLSAFRPLRLRMSSNNATCYMDPATEVVVPTTPNQAGASDTMHSLDLPSQDAPQDTLPKMQFEEFVSLLEQHRVDLSKFGKANAKTLEEFYHGVVRDEKCYLLVTTKTLERVVELVRISLRTRDNDNHLRELRIRSQPNAEGGVRVRNQPLAMVLNVAEKGQWQEAIKKCFTSKFNLSASVHSSCFIMDRDAYSYDEERSYSDSIPGILTTYKSHNITITVKDKTRRDLLKIGLPSCSDFTTESRAGTRDWTWTPAVDNNERELMRLLAASGIDVSEFTWHAFAGLHDEVYDKRQSHFETRNGEFVRIISIIKIWLHADILNLDHVLVVRAKSKGGETVYKSEGRTLSMRMYADQAWEDAVEEALHQRLGITSKQQCEMLTVFSSSHRIKEEVSYSHTYPGLKTLYRINEVSVRIHNPQDPHWLYMGLPGGTDFTFTRRECISKASEPELVITQWGWQLAVEFGVHQRPRVNMQPSLVDDKKDDSWDERKVRRRVLPPEALMVFNYDALLVGRLMLGRQTDWLRARRAAMQVREPSYTIKDFHDDVSHAFPELRLYCLTSDSLEGVFKASSLTGARTADDEYQRTIGSLFCMFWLMRMHLDGKECFCFGLDDNWLPRTAWDDSNGDSAEYQKRKAFYDNTDWAKLEGLLVGAGLLTQEGGPHDVERTLAFFVLMTIHDIMKLHLLRPTVGMGIKEFYGYKAGEVIGDHDIALTYVLEYCPETLPSFAGLSKAQQESIKFAHSKLDYNMGWLVQAEAPPGAIFRSFRNVIISGQASMRDIAFYFVHWFADLAGAEPYPLQGCEKFVLKFPERVLRTFVDSFSVVWTLGVDKDETQVFEDYLIWRWANHEPPLGDPPTGRGSIAKMRLVLMAQGDSKEILRQFQQLPEEDQQVLSMEMAMTGCSNQYYQRDDLSQSKVAAKGPAILVYYSPALLQKSGRKDTRCTLIILAEIYRQARELWPLNIDEAERSVIVRIDALKDLEAEDILHADPGSSYILAKCSGLDGQVSLLRVSAFRQLDWKTHQILDFNAKSKRRNRVRSVGNPSSCFPRLLPRMSYHALDDRR